MTDDPKDTIYIDVDDEITTVIDKLQSSPKKIVALVLPKRAAVFQSIVNMKLLKRTADTGKKNLVLVTSEAALLPLAGAVGLHVAKTPQSKPVIPPGPLDTRPTAKDSVDEDDPNLDKSTPVGSLVGAGDDEAIEVDNSTTAADAAGKKDKSSKKGKDANGKKKLRIPNFEKFRTKLFLGIAALVVLIGGYIMAFVVLPKATVTLKTDTTNIDVSLRFTASTNATSFDQESAVLPATSKEFRKTDTEKVAATGQKDVGTKATGSVTLSVECSPSNYGLTIPAGTAVSSGNLNYITRENAVLNDLGPGCMLTDTVDVTAQNAGEQYNVGSGRTFAVAGFSAVSGTNGAAMTGGTSKIVKVVQQDDIDKAKEAIDKRAGDEAPNELKESIGKEGLYPLAVTLRAGEPTVVATSKAGDEAADVTVTSTTVFTMLGVKEDDLKKLIEETAKEEIDAAKQGIRDNGLHDATMRIESQSSNQTILSLSTTAVAGPELDEEGIKNEIAGKKSSEARDVLEQRPGINDAEVEFSPFWVRSTPKNTNKITLIFESSQNNDDANDQSQ